MGFLGKSSGGATVGLNIGSSLIKVVEARPSKDGLQITALGVAPTPPGTIDNEIIVDPQALGQAIRQLLAESGITCKQCVSSVSGQSSVVVRIIEVPKMTRQELAETMKWEIERHVPFAANEVVMDFQPIERPGADPDDQNMEVLLAVAQQEFVNSHLETLLAAGLEPVVLDVEPLAVCRSLIDVSKDGAGEQTIAIVNIGAAATELGVYQNGLLAFPRTLPIAGDAATRALSDSLNIPIEQAERLKRERAIVLPERAAGAGFPEVEPVSDDTGPDAAVEVSAPAEGESAGDLDFIPGLGYGLGTPEQEAGDAASESPDFDVDISGEASESAAPSIDFDLSAGEEEPVSAPEPPTDLSEPSGDEVEVGDVPLPAVPSLVPSDESGEAALAQFSEETVFDAMAPVLSDLIAEIRRSLEYYTSRFQSQPDRLLLCGGTSKLQGLDKLLEAELGISTIVANPLQNVAVFSRALSQDYLEEVASVFPVSVGLAIRDLIGE